jgi:hypothetical protein
VRLEEGDVSKEGLFELSTRHTFTWPTVFSALGAELVLPSFPPWSISSTPTSSHPGIAPNVGTPRKPVQLFAPGSSAEGKVV